jgi:alpha-glucosidase (family GH31 glycosyl hydrolase)
MRSALQTRYTLLPYFYTLFFHAHTTGETVARPLFFEFPHDTVTFPIDRQFLVGPALLISPVLEQSATSVHAYIPAGVWYDFYTGAKVHNGWVDLDAPLEKINVHVRGGYIIPRQKDALNTVAQKTLPYNLIVAVQDNTSAGELYLDDGESQDSITTNNFTRVQYQLQFENNVYELRNKVTHGYDTNAVYDRVEVYGVSRPCRVELNGESVQYAMSGVKLVVNVDSKVIDDLSLKMYTKC